MSWSKGLVAETGGHGVVAHAGSAATRLLADRTGLTGGLSGALARRGFDPLHDRGRVITDLAVAIADGATAISDIDTLRHQEELLRPVASDSTVWRALSGCDAAALARVSKARARTRKRVWGLIAGRHGQIPAAKAARQALSYDLTRWPWIRARVQLAYGRWLARSGRPSEGATHLEDALEVFDRIGAVRWSRCARLELDELGGRGLDTPGLSGRGRRWSGRR